MQVNKKKAEQLELEANSDNEKYKVECICNNSVYAEQSEASQLSDFYYP